MKKSVLALALLTALTCVSFSGCQSGTAVKGNDKKLVVAATPVPHAELLNEVKGLMKDKGFELEVKEFTDYVLPNTSVEEGNCDANFFQHKPYLDDFNQEHNTHIVSVAKVHYEPLGIYKGTKGDLELAANDKIAVPNDTTNEARALQLLEANGIIKLKEGAGLKATKEDIIDNPYGIDIIELESAQIPRSLDSVAIACMNGNYALEAGYKVSEALAIEQEDSEAAQLYANILCVKEGNENKESVKALVECMKSETIKNFIDNKYNKSVIYIED